MADSTTTPANLTHMAARLMLAHLKDPKSTVQSVGVLYTLCIGAQPTFGSLEWGALHNAMRERFQPESDKAWLKKLDRIKSVGWKLRDAYAASIADDLAAREAGNV